MPWQSLVADVALELGPDGRFRYSELDITVPRQSGKSLLVAALIVHRLTAMVRTHGPQRATYTAQTRLAARKKLERDFDPLLRGSKSFTFTNRRRPQRATEWRISLNNGTEHIQLGASNWWQIDAPTREGGHGDTLDLAVLDEAFAHHDDELEGALSPTMATRRDALLAVISTAGDGQSAYLYRKVLSGRAAAESGEHGRIAYFEWSADEHDDPGDPRVWRSCSPALGMTIDERFIAAEWAKAQRKGPEGINTFRRTMLNQWPEVPVLEDIVGEQVIPVAAWSAVRDERSQIVGRVSLALDMNPERTWCAVAAAGRRSDGRLHVEVVQHEPGTGWPVPRLREIAGRQPIVTDDGKPVVVIDPRSPAWSLAADLERYGFKVGKPSSADVAAACGALVDDVTGGRCVHLGQPGLDAAVAGATKGAVGDGGYAWSRKHSSVDISPLVAVTLARWHASALTETDEEEANLW